MPRRPQPDKPELNGALPDESEGLIDDIRNIQGVKVALLFEEIEPELTRVSWRSKVPALDVSGIAVAFGGGGHLSSAPAASRRHARGQRRPRQPEAPKAEPGACRRRAGGRTR